MLEQEICCRARERHIGRILSILLSYGQSSLDRFDCSLLVNKWTIESIISTRDISNVQAVFRMKLERNYSHR